jgi:DNA end-binding protein Ku
MPVDDVLMMITLRYVDQIREHKELDVPPLSLKSAGVTAKELELAKRLIADMSGPWKPEEFEDTYNDDLMRRIEEKVKRGETKVLTKPEADKGEKRSAQVIDLMDLLKQSIGNNDGRARKAATKAVKSSATVGKVGDAPRARASKGSSSRRTGESKPAARRKRA